jgi:hypothetical protein
MQEMPQDFHFARFSLKKKENDFSLGPAFPMQAVL